MFTFVLHVKQLLISLTCLRAEMSRCVQKSKQTRNLDFLLLAQDVIHQHLVRLWGSRLLSYHYYYSSTYCRES
jgi:hypothetical protein